MKGISLIIKNPTQYINFLQIFVNQTIFFLTILMLIIKKYDIFITIIIMIPFR